MKDTPFTEARLLSLYDRVAEAEDAIPRLRRFVLDLAVRGKLVAQEAGDEPASVLLERIVKTTRARIEAGHFREPKNFLETKRTDLPFSPPSSWSWVRLIELCEVSYGFAFDSARFNSARKGNPLIRIRDISRQDTEAYFDGPFDPFYIVKNGDYLVGMDGDFNVRRWAGVDALLNQRVMRMRNWSHEVLASFVVLPLQEILNHLHGETSLTTVKHLSAKQINGVEIPLPPLAEQHRIVAKVEELMALLDRLEAARAAREDTRTRLTAATLSRLTEAYTDTPTAARFALQTLPALTTRPDQIKTLRQTILNLAVRGKLVEQNSGDEPVADLLASFRKAKLNLKQETGDARIKPASNPSATDYPGDLPTGWDVQSFENLFLFIDYRGNTPTKTESGVPLITAKNVRMRALNREPREYISPSTYPKWMTRGFPKAGDLFFTTEAPLANICVNDIDEPFALAQRVICLQPYSEINTHFIAIAVASDVMQKLIDDHATGMTARGIKAANLKPLPIPVPPLAEQHRIVAKVEELMSLCDRLERALQDATTTRARLLDATLREALAEAQEAA